MFANFFCHFQVLLTPPDEGPRVKGQRIKLQDIVEGVYNPLSSNNGCWISCEWPFFPRQNIKWSAEIINFTHNFSWRVSLPESMGRDSFIVHREKLDDVGAHFDVKHNLCEYCRHGPVGRCWFSSSPSSLLTTSQRADPPELHQVFFDFHFFFLLLPSLLPSHTLISAEISIRLCLMLRMRRVETTWRLAQKSVCCFLSR